MITADKIVNFKTASIDYQETQRLKQNLSNLRDNRNPLYLTSSELDEILKWKLRGQYGRQQSYRSANTEDVIKSITTASLNISHENEDYEIDLRFNILTALRGVGIPVASAILALVYPEKYAVIDFRGWRQVFGQDKSYFTISDYKKYIIEIRNLADELNWLPEEVDLAIWEYDRRYGN